MHTLNALCLLLLLQPQLLQYGLFGVSGAAININMDQLLNGTAPPVQENSLDFSSCYDIDLEETLSKQRLDVLRQEILSKLNLNEVPENPPEDIEIRGDVLASYQAALALDGAIEEERENEEQDGCSEKETFYAKEVMLHFPSQFAGEVPPINIFDWGPLLNDKQAKRSVDKKDDKDEDIFSKETKPYALEAPAPPPLYPQEHYSQDSSYIEAPLLSQYISPIRYSLTFADISIPSHVPLWSANLRLYKRKIISDNSLLKRDSNPTENIEVHLISNSVGVDGKPLTHPVLIASHDIRTEEDGYVSFDITPGIQHWLQNHNRSSKLDIEVFIRCPESVSTGLQFLPSVKFDVPYPGSKDTNNAQLVLKVITGEKTNSRRRTRRELDRGISSEYCLANPDEINCCLRELTINFREDLGWSWIIAPRTIKTNYCQGLCPAIWPSATMSRSFLNRLRLTNPTSAPEPCCVAKKVKPLTILIAIKGKLYLNRLQDVIVDSCDCR